MTSLTVADFSGGGATPGLVSADLAVASGQRARQLALGIRASYPLGLTINDPRAFRGYTLLSSLASPKTYLIELEGRVVHHWESSAPPALSGYLLPNGHLLRPCSLDGKPHHLNGPGAGGRIQEFAWEGELLWDFQFATDTLLPHHDVAQLPSGNVLVIAWERKSSEEARAAGRSDLPRDGHFLPDCLIEIKPTGKSTGEVVWQWHVWDHLIQDHDQSNAYFGNVSSRNFV